MLDLMIRNGHVVDPVHGRDEVADIAIKDGRIEAVGPSLEGGAREELDAAGKHVIPGIIDMHTHMRTVLGHPHAQRMIALAGVCRCRPRGIHDQDGEAGRCGETGPH